VDVKKHIMAKYGRQFVSAAVELRPDSAVNRLASLSCWGGRIMLKNHFSSFFSF